MNTDERRQNIKNAEQDGAKWPPLPSSYHVILWESLHHEHQKERGFALNIK